MDSLLNTLDLDELTVLAKLDIEGDKLSDALIKLKHANSHYDDEEIMIMLARLYARLGLFDKATPLFREYLSANPDSLIEKFQLGMSLFDSEKHQQALEIFEDVIQKEGGNHPPAMYYSALILSKHEQEEKRNEAVSILVDILSTVDSKNLFYQRAYEQLQILDMPKASQFSITDTASLHQQSESLLN